MSIQYKILSEINHSIGSTNIDDIKYCDTLIEYTLPNIIDFEWKNILQNPPENSSRSTLNDLKYISQLTLSRNSQDLELIQQVDDDATYSVKQLLTKHNLMFPQELFDQFYDATKYLIYNIKFLFNRPRPIQLAKIYNITIDLIDSDTTRTPAYPSGHTVYAKLAANIAASFYPELKQQLDMTAHMVGYARVCQGVHFPTDNTASILLADTIYHHLGLKIKV